MPPIQGGKLGCVRLTLASINCCTDVVTMSSRSAFGVFCALDQRELLRSPRLRRGFRFIEKSSSPARYFALYASESRIETCCSWESSTNGCLQPLRVRIQPCDSGAELVLFVGVVRHHEMNELGHTCIFRSRRLIAQNNQLRQPLQQRVLAFGEELWPILCWLALLPACSGMGGSKTPCRKARKMRCP